MINNIKKFLNENQDERAVEKVAERLNGILMVTEEVVYIAVQKKPAVNISPDCVALTTKRIIFFRPKNLGFTMEFQDYLWKDVVDCHLKEEFLGGVFTVVTNTGLRSTIDYLPKVQARKVYTLSQEQEEVQREFRRQQEMEEKRAGAGNVVVTSTTPTTNQSTGGVQEDPLTTLQKLKSLFDHGLITQAEYDNKKMEVLNRM
jgi:hypothetical protein